MKRITACCLSLILVFLLVFAAAEGFDDPDDVVVVEKWEDEFREYAESEGGGYRRVCDELPLEVWVPGSLTEVEIGADAKAEGVVGRWRHEEYQLDFDFVYYPEAPVPRSAESVSEFRTRDVYEPFSHLYLIKGIPAMVFNWGELTNPDNAYDDIVTWDCTYFYMDDGSCFLIRMHYPIEEIDDAEYFQSIIHYSISRTD